MAFHVRDPATDLAVRCLSKLKGKSLTAAIREAVENEYKRECAQRKLPLWSG
jgi:antitoxin VapB